MHSGDSTCTLQPVAAVPSSPNTGDTGMRFWTAWQPPRRPRNHGIARVLEEKWRAQLL